MLALYKSAKARYLNGYCFCGFLPTSSDDEMERESFVDNLEFVLADAQSILDDPERFSMTLSFAWCAYSGENGSLVRSKSASRQEALVLLSE